MYDVQITNSATFTMGTDGLQALARACRIASHHEDAVSEEGDTLLFTTLSTAFAAMAQAAQDYDDRNDLSPWDMDRLRKRQERAQQEESAE